MEKVLVTGGAGFIGSNLSRKLLDLGYEVIIFDSLSKGDIENIRDIKEKVKFIEGNIKNKEIIDNAMKGVDYVFHTASIQISDSSEFLDECIDVNIKGSYNIFRSACENKIKRLIFSSSSSVYGDPEKLPTSENDLINAKDPYGASKWMCEKILEFLGKKYGMEYNILRYFNVYGPRQPAHAYYTRIITGFIKKILKDEELVVEGDENQSMDLIHVSDVVNANILAMKSEAKNEVFNIGTGISTTLSEIAGMILENFGINKNASFIKKKVICKRRQADMKKAESLLEFRPKVNLKEGLNKLINDLKSECN